MNRELERMFFREFQTDGVATLTLGMALFEYCGVGGETPARPDYPDGVLSEIKYRTENLDVWPFYGVENDNPLFDEITDNLDSRISDESKELYVKEIIRKFQLWTFHYSLGAKKLDAISNTVTPNSLEMYFWQWRSAFLSFTHTFASILAERGLNLLEIQDRCHIKIIDKLEVRDLLHHFGTIEAAEESIAKLKISVNTTEIKPHISFTNAGAKKLFDKIRSLDWIDNDKKKCFGFKDDDSKPFICMLLGKTSTSKMKWIAVTPKNVKQTYIKPLVELLYLCGFSWEEIPIIFDDFFENQVNISSIRNIKSDIRKQEFSNQYNKLKDIVEKSKAQK